MIFVDTAAFLAIENRKDAHHDRSVRFRDACVKSREIFVTTDYVLDESYTIIRIKAGHSIATGFGEAVRGTSLIQVEYLTRERIEEAWDIFKTYSDHDFSFTDCTSFALMQYLSIDTVFTFDHHFREFGKFIMKP